MENFPLFVNHYQTKLPIDNIFFDVYFLLILAFGIFITLKKSPQDRPLSFLQTNQMRGVGITLIILNHICYYTQPRPSLYEVWAESGMVGVALFLMISGYGLCISLEKKGIHNFFTNRISKILVPLFLGLSLLQFLYWALTPEVDSLGEALFEIVFSMQSLDRKTWFIIFILFWYCLLYLTYKLQLSPTPKILFLCSISFVLISSPQANDLVKANAFSFPIGCWMGLNASIVQAKLDRFLHRPIVAIVPCLMGIILGSVFLFWPVEKFRQDVDISVILGVAILVVLLGTVYLGYLYRFKKIRITISSEVFCGLLAVTLIYLNYTSQFIDQNLLDRSNIYWGLVRNLANIGLAISLMLVVSMMSKFNVYSSMLNFLGSISFELFLVHNTFLIHFDFFLFRLPIVLGFPIYFAMVCAISVVLKQLSAQIVKQCFPRLPPPAS